MELPKEYIKRIENIPNLNIQKLKESFDEQAFLGLRINTNKWVKNNLNQENLQKYMKNYNILGNFEQISWCDTGFYIKDDMKLGKSILHELGLFYIQEPSAMAPVEFLNIQS